MPAVQNAKHIFKQIPKGFPEPEVHTVTDTSETIDLENVPLNGGFLVKTLALSIDPYMRGRMRDASVKSYFHAFTLNEPLDNNGVGVVVRSEHAGIKAGQHVYGWFKFQEYFVASDPAPFRVLADVDIPLSVYVGVAGMPGQTAWYSWQEYSKAKKGEVAFVTTGAGPVGATVIQLAKQQGLKVIGSAGSDEKVQFMKEIGADVAFNYKTTSTKEILEKEGPIDIYFDNVGGETLEAALEAAAKHARFIECGMISGYNSETGYYGIKNMNRVFEKCLSMNGFLVGELAPKYKEDFYKTIPQKIAAGEIKYKEQRYEGLGQVGQAILDVQSGKNKGKAVIIVADH